MAESPLLSALAKCLITGELTVEQIVIRGSRTLGKHWRWLRPLAQRYLNSFSGQTRPRYREVVAFLRHDREFRRAWFKHRDELWVGHWLIGPDQMQPVPAAEDWNLPRIDSPGALAEWLGLEAGELRWFSDLKGLGYKHDRPVLNHYHYRVLAKQSGHVRLIEAPKKRLKGLQRQILARILEKIPAHPSTHGFVKGRSIKTFVAPHISRRVVLRMDLRDFFPTISGARIQSFFRTLGYPESVADLLGGICTNATPRVAWKELPVDIDRSFLPSTQRLHSRPHLPQGAPTSPALANLCTYRVDCRLEALAKSVGAQYSRYADDLAFSGDSDSFERRIETFSLHVAALLMEEGFTVHHRKTRVMRQGVRQHLAGIVANRHLNVVRTDFDQLKAILTNCVRLGPESQNRDGHPGFRLHLEGRVGFVQMINPARGKRLRLLLERIAWP